MMRYHSGHAPQRRAYRYFDVATSVFNCAERYISHVALQLALGVYCILTIAA